MNCGTCTNFKRGDGKMAKHGYHNCRDIPEYSYITANSKCRFNPSRYVLNTKPASTTGKKNDSSGDAILDLFGRD